AAGEMADRLKHLRQSLCHALDVRIELVIGAAGYFGELSERMLGRPLAALLKQEQSGARGAQLLGGSHRNIEVAVEEIADDDHRLHGWLMRFAQCRVEDVAGLDEAAADAVCTTPAHDVAPVGSVRNPVRRNAGTSSLPRTFASEVSELDVDRRG